MSNDKWKMISSSANLRSSRPRIGITMGDPAGIGPEVVLKAVAEDEVQSACVPVIIGDAQLLAHLTATEEYAMGFVAENLRIVLISTHVPLHEAIRLVTRERIEKTIRLADRELRRWGLERPRIAVAALNPHGAEGGLFGIEEASEIVPAVEACHVTDDINVRGPYPADTIFLRASRGEFDAVVACYHDQAMIPVKCLSFGEAVNVTLGLPFIRTSVDHGTAFDIAGKGIAEHSSMVAAIKLAAELSLRAGESGQAMEARS